MSGIVSFRNAGRFGNFLYQSAMAFGYSKKYDIEFSVPNYTHNKIWSPIYLQHLVSPNHQQGREDVLINENWNDQRQYNEYEYKPEWKDKHVIFNGYNQSFKYWHFCRDEMLDAFGFPWKENKGVASIHARRGDYLQYPTKHPVITIEYLQKAVEILHFKGIRKFLFHSDDIPWCMSCGLNLMFPDCEFEYSVGKNEVEDLISMANCEHQICSNSTLSTWAGELNRNPNKVVIVPAMSNWFGPDNKLTVADMYRPEWVQISYKPIYMQ